jgi:hypothetical protein
MIELVLLALIACGSGVASYFSYRSARATSGGLEQIVATRKQAKAVLTLLQQATAQAQRINDKHYRQQKDVDDILYHAKVAREREEQNG